jgi:hypothetical protein
MNTTHINYFTNNIFQFFDVCFESVV